MAKKRERISRRQSNVAAADGAQALPASQGQAPRRFVVRWPSHEFRRCGQWLWRQRLLFALLLVAAALRILPLTLHDLWVDEINTYDDLMVIEDRPPLRRFHWLSFVMYRASVAIADTPFFLRLPSALAGVFVLLPFYGFLRQRLKKPEALMLTALLAFMPYNVHYSMEARYYAHVFLFSTFGLYFLARFCHSGSLLALIFYFAAHGAAVMCHPVAGSVALGMTLAIALCVLTRPRRWWRRAAARRRALERRFGVVLVRTVVVLQVLVLLVIGLAGLYVAYRLIVLPNVTRWEQPLPRGVSFDRGFFWNHLAFFARGRWGDAWLPHGSVGAWLAVFGLAMAWWRHRFFALVATCAYAGGVGLLFFSRATIPYTPKYTSALAPIVLMLMGVGLLELARFASRWVRHGSSRAWLGGLCAALVLFWTPSLWQHYTGQFMPVRYTFEYASRNSEGPVRPCIAAQGLSNFVMKYYQHTEYPSLFQANQYLAAWPRAAMAGFMESLSHSEIPLWYAITRVDYERGMDPDQFGEWCEPVVFESLTPRYDMLLFQKKNHGGSRIFSPPPGPEGERRYRAAAFDNIRPRWAGVTGEGEDQALVAISNVSADYAIGHPRDNVSRLSVVGRNVANFPRLVEIRIEKEPVGMFVFEPNQETPTTITMVLADLPEKDPLRLTLSVLDSLTPVNYAATYDADRIELYGFSVHPASEEALPLRTESHLHRGNLVPPPPGFLPGRFLDPARPGAFPPGWLLVPEDTKLSVDMDEGIEVLSIHVDKCSEGGVLGSALAPAQAGEVVYVSLDIRPVGLWTHSTNMRVVFYDGEANITGMSYAETRSLQGDEPWRRLTVFSGVPTNTETARIKIDFWRNAHPVRMIPGRIDVRNLVFETPRPMPSIGFLDR